MIEGQFFTLTIFKQPLAQHGVAIADKERNALLHFGRDVVEGGKSQVAGTINNLCQELGAHQIEPFDGMHQRVRYVEARRADVPRRVRNRRKREQ